MRRMLAAGLCAVIVGLPGLGEARRSRTAILPAHASRIALIQAASDDPPALVLDGTLPRTHVLEAGPLGGAPGDDVIIARTTTSDLSASAGVTSHTVELWAVDAPTGSALWGPVTVARAVARGREVAAGAATYVRARTLLDGDAVPDVVVSSVDVDGNASNVRAFSGATGALLWDRAATAAAVQGPNGTTAEANVAVVLAPPADVDGDGLEDVLVGRYTGGGVLVDGAPAAATWGLQVDVLSGADGAPVKPTLFASGEGMAPSATFARISDNIPPDIVVADVTATAASASAVVRVFTAGAPAPFDAAQVPWSLVTVPPVEAGVALTLSPRAGEASQAGGLAVGFGSGGRPLGSQPVRPALEGPSTVVGLGRGGIPSFTIALGAPAIVAFPGDVNGDRIDDVRTVRASGDSMVVETWSGHGENVALAPAHQMTFLEGDDYVKATDVHAQTPDVDGDGLAELLVGGGYPCGPRYEMLDGRDAAARWSRAEIRGIGCFGRLFPVDGSLGGANADVVDWTTHWYCCVSGPTPFEVEVRARNGATGATIWSRTLPEIRRADHMSGALAGDALVVATDASSGGCCPDVWTFRLYGLNAVTGEVLWS